MIGIDTNVLLRILTGDDAEQQRTALTFLRTRCSGDDPAWINRIVCVELVWVLQRAYKYSREQIADALHRLLHTAEFDFEDHDGVRSALEDYRRGTDFADALIGRCNQAASAVTTVTFDAAAAKRLDTHTLIAREQTD